MSSFLLKTLFVDAKLIKYGNGDCQIEGRCCRKPISY